MLGKLKRLVFLPTSILWGGVGGNHVTEFLGDPLGFVEVLSCIAIFEHDHLITRSLDHPIIRSSDRMIGYSNDRMIE